MTERAGEERAEVLWEARRYIHTSLFLVLVVGSIWTSLGAFGLGQAGGMVESMPTTRAAAEIQNRNSDFQHKTKSRVPEQITLSEHLLLAFSHINIAPPIFSLHVLHVYYTIIYTHVFSVLQLTPRPATLSGD